MIQTPRRPDLDAATARELAAEHFGIDGAATPLPGERDRNFLLEGPAGDRHVLKVASPDEPGDVLDFESALLVWLAEEGSTAVPRPVPTRGGDLIARAEEAPSEPWRIRLLEHLPGTVLARVRPRTSDLLENVGRELGTLDRLLASYPGTPPEREAFDWALARAGGVVERGLRFVTDPARRACLEHAIGGLDGTRERVADLPRQVVHGDVNDHNILVSAPLEGPRRVTGILDFGDVHEAPAIFDLAIALAYLMMEHPDPVGAAVRVVTGYHERRPLTEAEVDLLIHLARARLAASVSISAWRRSETPDVDDYLLISETPAWKVLLSLEGVHDRLATGRLREACGYPACARTSELVRWLATCDPSPALDLSAEPGELTILDLSVGSPLLDGHDTDDTAAFAGRVFGAMDEAGAKVGVGRYDEPRGFYLTEAFDTPGGEMPERRTIHLGIDLFVPPGTGVRTPLGGMVRSVQDNSGRLDYGPTVIIEHQSPGRPFWTLYGHLERASVRDLEAGTKLEAGDAFARVGPYPENGDWPEHLHFQIVADLLDRSGEFPGVARPGERSTWCSISPDPNLLLRLDGPTRYEDPVGLAARRARALGASLSLSYRESIHVVRGRGVHLFDALGRGYLDCVNNVAHVGHEHPHVVRAGQRQMAVLNTNTRYLHEAVLEYAERLGSLFPDPLGVCFFVNSGSEANELALRMAHAHSGGTGVVALEGAYHGNTGRLIEVSHYKFAGRGGEGPPPWVRAAVMPDDYRGIHRRDDPQRAARYARHVADAFRDLESSGHVPSAFLAESLLSCGGQVELPPGYLAAAYGHARAAGAVCIADEVQVGFGRVGTHLWGFETQSVVPDIVTLGKPIGNGHPLGAVVTTTAIARSFANGMEFFSTFGGNPVSAVIGSAVLDVLEREGLQEHAARVGDATTAALKELGTRHPAVGDVRGRGLFLGVELVSDPGARTPAPEVARYVTERMKARGVLLSRDGPDHNVLKIKPPLPFSSEDAERLVADLDRVLGEDFVTASCR